MDAVMMSNLINNHNFMNKMQLDIDIDEELCRASSENKYRVYEAMISPSLNEDERIKVIISEYGAFNHTAHNRTFSSVSVDDSGMKYYYSDGTFTELSWRNIYNRLSNIIRTGNYMLGYEIDNYMKWLLRGKA